MKAIIITLALGIALSGSGLFSSAAGGEKDKVKIRPVTKTVEGKLQKMDVKKGLLMVKKGQDERVTVRLAAETKIRIDGKPGTLDQLKVGDVLVVTYEIRQQGNVAQLVALNRPR